MRSCLAKQDHGYHTIHTPLTKDCKHVRDHLFGSVLKCFAENKGPTPNRDHPYYLQHHTLKSCKTLEVILPRNRRKGHFQNRVARFRSMCVHRTYRQSIPIHPARHRMIQFKDPRHGPFLVATVCLGCQLDDRMQRYLDIRKISLRHIMKVCVSTLMNRLAGDERDR